MCGGECTLFMSVSYKIHGEFNGVKGTGPLAEGSEGRQSLPFFEKPHDFLMHPIIITPCLFIGVCDILCIVN